MEELIGKGGLSITSGTITAKDLQPLATAVELSEDCLHTL